MTKEQKYGTLYVVATPIGNLEDITVRALKTLGSVDLIAAEDTRHTRKLMAHHGIDGTLTSYHEHNEQERTPQLIRRLQNGHSLALVSNAGTPSVSDPGFRLIKASLQTGIRVVPIPGASAAITALSGSGLPTDTFVFVGFLPKKKKRRTDQLRKLAEESRTLIFYEAPHRLENLIQELIVLFGDRPAVLAREMTKIHEEFLHGNLSELSAILKHRSAVRGECTLLVSGWEADAPRLTTEVTREIQEALSTPGKRLSEAVKEIAADTGLPRSKVYEEALKMKKNIESDEFYGSGRQTDD